MREHTFVYKAAHSIRALKAFLYSHVMCAAAAVAAAVARFECRTKAHLIIIYYIYYGWSILYVQYGYLTSRHHLE